MSIKFIFALFSAVLLSACASAPTTLYKMSDKDTIRSAEGVITKFEMRRVPIPITTTEAALTGVAAKNLRNSTVQGATLLLGVIDDITTPKYQNNVELVFLDAATGEESALVMKNFARKPKIKIGDRFRIIYKSETDYQFFNLTSYPQADAVTR